MRLRAHRRAHRALGGGRRREAPRRVPHQGAGQPRGRPFRGAGVPRADARQPRPHARALAGAALQRDAGKPVKAVPGMRGYFASRPAFSWALYDWANSAFATTVMAGFFPTFFRQFWSAGAESTMTTFRLGVANAVAGLAIALLAPLLGA